MEIELLEYADLYEDIEFKIMHCHKFLGLVRGKYERIRTNSGLVSNTVCSDNQKAYQL